MQEWCSRLSHSSLLLLLALAARQVEGSDQKLMRLGLVCHHLLLLLDQVSSSYLLERPVARQSAAFAAVVEVLKTTQVENRAKHHPPDGCGIEAGI